MSYIKRQIENLLVGSFKNYKSITLTGARQVGKSTLITNAFPEVKKINLLDSLTLEMAKTDPALLLKSYGTPLFIDEIQKAPDIFSQIKVKLDNTTKDSQYIFSGSQKRRLMQGLTDTLVGQTSIFQLETLSMREIFNVDNLNVFLPSFDYIKNNAPLVKKYNDIYNYIFRGFYPRLYENQEISSEQYYRDYVVTYIERDVYDIIKIQDALAFRKFLVCVASRTGQLLNYQSIASEVEQDVKTIKQRMSVLEKTNIIFLLKPYTNSHLSRAIKTPKIYFKDTGLASYLTSWLTKETLELGNFSGQIFETFVINEIVKSFSNSGLNPEDYLFFYRGKDKLQEDKETKENEIDLVIDYGRKLYPIEIKKTSNPKAIMTKSFRVLDKVKDKERGMGTIVCLVDNPVYLRDNLVALPIEYL